MILCIQGEWFIHYSTTALPLLIYSPLFQRIDFLDLEVLEGLALGVYTAVVLVEEADLKSKYM